MRDDDIPVKTDAGLAEIKTRSLGLAPRVRTALLLVDGVKSIGELNQLLAASGVKPGTLELLVEKGLIHIPAHEQADIPAASAPTIAPMPETIQKAEAAPAVKEAEAAEAAPAPKPMPTPKAAPPVDIAPVSRPVPEARMESTLKAELPPKAEAMRKMEPIRKVEPVLDAPPVLKAAPAPESIAPALGLVSMPAQAQDDRYDTEPAPEISIPVPVPPEDMKLVVARAHLANALDEHVGVQGYVLKQMVAGCASRAELASLFDAVEKAMSKSLDKAGSTRVIGISKALLES